MSSTKPELKVNVILTREGVIILLMSFFLLTLGVSSERLLIIIPSLFIPLVFVIFGLSIPKENIQGEIELNIPTSEIKAKQFLPVSVKITNTKQDFRFIVSIEVSDGLFPVVSSQSSIVGKNYGTTFLFYAARRGKESIGRLIFKYGGIPGLFHYEMVKIVNREIIIVPEPQRIPLPWKMKQKILEQIVADISIPVKGRGFDFFALRDYQYGDEVRHIHWKASAKYNSLIVKEFEEPMMLRFLIIVDSSLYMAGPKLEFALSSVAELASVIHKSSHSLSVVTHGNNYTKLYHLGNSTAALRTLSINLHGVKSEGSKFNYEKLHHFIKDHKLQGSVLIMLTDLEMNVEHIAKGMALLKSNMQHIFFLACNTPGFGTLALANVQDTRMYEIDEINYRRLIVEPSLRRIYNSKERQYSKTINSQSSGFNVIESYNTNVLLELQKMLKTHQINQPRRLTN